MRLINRGAGLNLYQNNRGRCNRDRRGRMQKNTKRAVVGVGVYRMHVGNLNHRQQSQQNQAHHGNNRQSEWLCAASSAEMCAKSWQSTAPVIKNTQYWMRTG
jgi:hypothetical protein